MDIPKAVYGKDGRLLGVTYDDDKVLKRGDYCSSDEMVQDMWDDFLNDIGRIITRRLPRDTESPQAIALIEKDNERLRGLGIDV